MPRSDPEGRDWAVERLKEATTPIVFDVGCGEGTYSDLARGWTDALWVGVEVWEPYIHEFALNRKYDIVLNKDLIHTRLPEPNVPFTLIAGDVLEHMPRHISTAFLNYAKQRATHILVSLPVVEYPQHGHDNPYEDHLDQWSFADMWDALLPGRIHAWRGEILGRFWWTRSS